MGAKFDSEIIVLDIGDSLMETLTEVLRKKGFGERIDGDQAIFIVDDVTVKEINGSEIICEVEYEYGM